MLDSRLNRLPRVDSDLSLLFFDIIPKAMGEVRLEIRKHRDFELSVAHFRVLVQLSKGPKTNKDLSEHLGVSVAATSRMVQALIDKDWVERATGIEDRRQVQITLSKSGRQAYDELRRKASLTFAQRFAALSSLEKKQLSEALHTIKKLF